MLCAKCKGRLLCGRIKCPLLEKFRFLKSIEIKEGEVNKPTPPSVFIGRIGYPKVYVGPMISVFEENPEFLDSPWLWHGEVSDIIKLRMNLIRGKKEINVNSVENKFIENLQEIAASVKHVSLELELEKLHKKPTFDDVLQPIGLSADLGKIIIAENPKIPKKVEKIWNDDITAAEGMKILHNSRYMSYYIQKILSVGLLGKRKHRKLVPTRWSITAVHSILGEELKKDLYDAKSVNEFFVFKYEHFGNKFTVFIFPGRYNFKLIEIWRENSFWSPTKTWIGWDEEHLRRKKKYSKLGGGYYAARFPILEYLNKMKKVGNVIVIREITPEYYAPIGVWVVEEGVRRALQNPKKLSSKDEIMKTVKRCTDEKTYRSIKIKQLAFSDLQSAL